MSDWTAELASLAAYFRSKKLPDVVTLTNWELITDVSQFIDSHLAYCHANNGHEGTLPYLERLRKLKTIIK